MAKEIKFGKDARERIKAGIDKATAAVAPTLGAVGMTAIIDWEGLDPLIEDDGAKILKNLEFKDKYENMGLKMLRKAALRTSSEGGVAQVCVEEGYKVSTGERRLRKSDSPNVLSVKAISKRGTPYTKGYRFAPEKIEGTYWLKESETLVIQPPKENKKEIFPKGKLFESPNKKLNAIGL